MRETPTVALSKDSAPWQESMDFAGKKPTDLGGKRHVYLELSVIRVYRNPKNWFEHRQASDSTACPPCYSICPCPRIMENHLDPQGVVNGHPLTSKGLALVWSSHSILISWSIGAMPSTLAHDSREGTSHSKTNVSGFIM